MRSSSSRYELSVTQFRKEGRPRAGLFVMCERSRYSRPGAVRDGGLEAYASLDGRAMRSKQVSNPAPATTLSDSVPVAILTGTSPHSATT